jgi:hypothetical protein
MTTCKSKKQTEISIPKQHLNFCLTNKNQNSRTNEARKRNFRARELGGRTRKSKRPNEKEKSKQVVMMKSGKKGTRQKWIKEGQKMLQQPSFERKTCESCVARNSCKLPGSLAITALIQHRGIS